ncbi:MAG: DUF91 domain-containing protein [Candidatus Nanopelagicales bacterium]|nr:DUF91 domain-containing protein [Candidatus Nanopelagicales bacterium]
MRIVIARCTVNYVGRLKAHLPAAVRVIMIQLSDPPEPRSEITVPRPAREVPR